MPQLELTPAQRRELRSRAHHLDPVVLTGGEGLTEAVVHEIDAALAAHGLIKVRLTVDSRDEREAALSKLCDRVSAAPVQHIGKLLVLWRPPADKPRALREDRGAGPRTVKVRVVDPRRSTARRAQAKKLQVLGNQRVTAGGSIKRAKPRTTSPKKLVRD